MGRLMLVIALALSVMGFTWEGKLDPDEFDDWKVVGSAGSVRPGAVHYILKNPNKDSIIRRVAVHVDTSSRDLLGYRYFEYGEPHLFTFERRRSRYIELKLTQREVRRCMECHPNEETTREISNGRRTNKKKPIRI